ncbi:MAG: ArnT family glycosyltransferase [Planctomycetaceae bacterium]
MVRGRTWLIAILIVALIGRLIAAWIVPQIAGDAEGYWQLAQHIAAGEEYSLYDPPRRVHRMPGFPLLLAVSMTLFGESKVAAQCLLALIGTAACGSVYLLARRLFDERVALIACGLTAISPAMTGFSAQLLSETFFALTLTMSLWCAAYWLPAESREPKAESRYPLFWSLLTGLSIAIATYVRPSWMLAGPLLAVLVILFKKPRGRACLESAVMLIGLFGTLLPWAWRNHEVSGHWIFTTLWSGPSLYDGLNPDANGDSNMTFFDRDNLMATMSEWDVDQHYKQAAWQYAGQHPGRAIELTFLKLWRYWKPWPSAKEFGGFWKGLLVAAFFVPVCVLAARGGWLARQQPWTWLLTLGPIFYFAAIHAVFVGSLRYRLPAEYPLCVLAAAGVCDFFQRQRGGRNDE